MQKLQNHGGSRVVTIPRAMLERDGILEDGAIPDSQLVAVDQLGERTYLVRMPAGAELPDPQECDVVERLATQRLLQEDAFSQQRANLFG